MRTLRALRLVPVDADEDGEADGLELEFGPRRLLLPRRVLVGVLLALAGLTLAVVYGLVQHQDRGELQETLVEAGGTIETQADVLASAGLSPVPVAPGVASAVTSAASAGATAPPTLTATATATVRSTATVTGPPVPGAVLTVTATSPGQVITVTGPAARVVERVETTVTGPPVPGPETTVTRDVPGPGVTVTRDVPGPETTVEVPGPVVTVTEPAPPPVTVTETVTAQPPPPEEPPAEPPPGEENP